MKFKLLLPIISLLIFLGGCSASYKQLSTMENKEPKNFQEHLLSEYKKRASFEAEEMHDWNSAKLYSIKAIKSYEGKLIKPEPINNRNIKDEHKNDLLKNDLQWLAKKLVIWSIYLINLVFLTKVFEL